MKSVKGSLSELGCFDDTQSFGFVLSNSTTWQMWNTSSSSVLDSLQLPFPKSEVHDCFIATRLNMVSYLTGNWGRGNELLKVQYVP